MPRVCAQQILLELCNINSSIFAHFVAFLLSYHQLCRNHIYELFKIQKCDLIDIGHKKYISDEVHVFSFGTHGSTSDGTNGPVLSTWIGISTVTCKKNEPMR